MVQRQNYKNYQLFPQKRGITNDVKNNVNKTKSRNTTVVTEDFNVSVEEQVLIQNKLIDLNKTSAGKVFSDKDVEDIANKMSTCFGLISDFFKSKDWNIDELQMKWPFLLSHSENLINHFAKLVSVEKKSFAIENFAKVASKVLALCRVKGVEEDYFNSSSPEEIMIPLVAQYFKENPEHFYKKFEVTKNLKQSCYLIKFVNFLGRTFIN